MISCLMEGLLSIIIHIPGQTLSLTNREQSYDDDDDDDDDYGDDDDDEDYVVNWEHH